MKKMTRLISILILLALWLVPAASAEEVKPAEMSEDQKLDVLRDNWKKATEEYRDALKSRKESLSREIKDLQREVEKEANQEQRRKIMDRLRKSIEEHEELSSKIRVIAAGEVVHLSNNKDKVVSFLTNQ